MCSLRPLSSRFVQHSAIQALLGLALLAASGAAAPDPSPALPPPGGHAPEGLTGAAWTQMRAAVERDLYGLQAQGDTYRAANPAQGLSMTFGQDGFEVRPGHGEGQWRWGLRLRAYGYGDRLHPPAPAARVVSDNRIEYRRGDLVEWYVNDHRGLEQGFTLNRRPAGPGGDAPLQLQLSPTGDLSPALTGDARGIEWRQE